MAENEKIELPDFISDIEKDNSSKKNNSKTKEDGLLKNLFKKDGDKSEPSKHVYNPIIAAKNKFKTFVKVTVTASLSLAIAHSLITTSPNTTDFTEEQLAAYQQNEQKFSAGLNNVELTMLQTLRAISGLTSLELGLTPEKRQKISQASINQMLKDYPPYPEKNTSFLVEAPENFEIRTQVMNNLINSGYFKKNPVILDLDEDMFANYGTQIQQGKPVNQSQMFPYSKSGVEVGSKVVPLEKKTFYKDGTISQHFISPIAEGSAGGVPVDFIRKTIDLIPKVTHSVMHLALIPTYKFKGVFNSDMSEYEFDQSKLKTKQFEVKTKTNAEKIPSTYKFLGYNEKDNAEIIGIINKDEQTTADKARIWELSNKLQSQRNKETKQSLIDKNKKDKAEYEEIKKKLKDIEKKYAQPVFSKEEKPSKSNVDKKEILNNVKNFVSPDPKTVEESSKKGVEMINKQRNKP